MLNKRGVEQKIEKVGKHFFKNRIIGVHVCRLPYVISLFILDHLEFPIPMSSSNVLDFFGYFKMDPFRKNYQIIRSVAVTNNNRDRETGEFPQNFKNIPFRKLRNLQIFTVNLTDLENKGVLRGIESCDFLEQVKLYSPEIPRDAVAAISRTNSVRKIKNIHFAATYFTANHESFYGLLRNLTNLRNLRIDKVGGDAARESVDFGKLPLSFMSGNVAFIKFRVNCTYSTVLDRLKLTTLVLQNCIVENCFVKYILQDSLVEYFQMGNCYLKRFSTLFKNRYNNKCRIGCFNCTFADSVDSQGVVINKTLFIDSLGDEHISLFGLKFHSIDKDIVKEINRQKSPIMVTFKCEVSNEWLEEICCKGLIILAIECPSQTPDSLSFEALRKFKKRQTRFFHEIKLNKKVL